MVDLSVLVVDSWKAAHLENYLAVELGCGLVAVRVATSGKMLAAMLDGWMDK